MELERLSYHVTLKKLSISRVYPRSGRNPFLLILIDGLVTVGSSHNFARSHALLMFKADEVEQLRRKLADAEQRAGAAEQRAEAAERLTQRTTFPEFLEICHRHFTVPLRIETDRSLTTKGSITDPKQRKHPTYLRPWLDFPQSHLRYFDAAYALLSQDDDRVGFTPRIALEEEGQSLCERALTSEKDLEYYDRSAVGEKVRQVLRQLISLESVQELTNHCTAIEFQNHLNALGEVSTDDTKRQRASAVDQVCICRQRGGERRPLWVREYKPAHKLSSEYLRAGLRSMSVRDEVVRRSTIPTESGEKLKYHADRLVAAAVTQTFEYMVDNGLEYSSIATGAAEVFLRVREDDPETVYYYLTEPKLDVEGDNEYGFRYPFTAIARLLGFSLMAMHSRTRNQAWRHSASQRLHLWTEDFEDVLHQIPAEDRRDSPEGSLYSSPGYPIDPRSPYLTRRSRILSSKDPEPFSTSFGSDSSSEGPGAGHPTVQETPSRAAATKRKRTSTQSISKQTTGSDSQRARQYCTMKCLAGIRYRRDLDPRCPNYVEHKKGLRDQVHSLDLFAFAQQVRSQLDADMDHNCHPQGIQGSCGVLFQVTLASHGYTFVAKGTVKKYHAKLLHEGNVYQHLFPLQASATAVYLGNIDLSYPYYYDFGVKIYHMLLMSWGGLSLYDCMPPLTCPALEQEKQRSFRAISQLSVVHDDWRLPNMLWNEEMQRVLVIDFERSHIRRHVKRKRDESDIT